MSLHLTQIRFVMQWIICAKSLEKSVFHICKNKGAAQFSCTDTAQLISPFVFCNIDIVQFLYFLNPKFHASCSLLWLHSLVYVGNPKYRFCNTVAHFMVFMPPTLKKWGAYWFQLVRPCVCPSICSKKIQARVLKFHIWIPRQKIADPFFFLSELSPLAELCPF